MRTFDSLAAIAITWLAESLRPTGGTSEGATGIGASGLDVEVPVVVCPVAAEVAVDAAEATDAAEPAA